MPPSSELQAKGLGAPTSCRLLSGTSVGPGSKPGISDSSYVQFNSLRELCITKLPLLSSRTGHQTTSLCFSAKDLACKAKHLTQLFTYVSTTLPYILPDLQLHHGPPTAVTSRCRPSAKLADRLPHWPTPVLLRGSCSHDLRCSHI